MEQCRSFDGGQACGELFQHNVRGAQGDGVGDGFAQRHRIGDVDARGWCKLAEFDGEMGPIGVALTQEGIEQFQRARMPTNQGPDQRRVVTVEHAQPWQPEKEPAGL